MQATQAEKKLQGFRICTNFRELTWQEYITYVKTQNLLNAFNIDEQTYYLYYEIIQEAINLLNETALINKVEVDILDFAFSDYLEILQCLQDADYYLDILCVLAKVEYKDREKYKERKRNEAIDKDIDLFYSVCEKVLETEKDLQEYIRRYAIEKAEEKSAGIDKFLKKWGYYAVIDNLTKSDITKQQEVLNMKTLDVLAKIKYDVEKNYYAEKLRKEYEATIKRTASNRK